MDLPITHGELPWLCMAMLVYQHVYINNALTYLLATTHAIIRQSFGCGTNVCTNHDSMASTGFSPWYKDGILSVIWDDIWCLMGLMLMCPLEGMLGFQKMFMWVKKMVNMSKPQEMSRAKKPLHCP